MCPAATAASAKRSPGRWPWRARRWPCRAATQAKAEALADALARAGHEALGLAMDAHSVASVQVVGRHRGAAFGRPRHPGQLRGHPARAGPARSDRGNLRRSAAGEPEGRHVPRAGGGRHQIAGGRGGAQIHLLSVRAQLGLRGRGYSAYCGNQGRAGDADPPARERTGGARHHRQRHRADRGAHGDGAPLAGESGDQGAGAGRIPLGAWPIPKDVAGAAVFFASPAASFITGQVLYVDGGITASQ